MENELEEDLDNELRNEIEPNKNLRGKSYFDAISQVCACVRMRARASFCACLRARALLHFFAGGRADRRA